MLGVSVYFKDLNYTYLKECSKLGIHYVFTSLHIPEEDYSHIETLLPQFIEMCNDYNLYLVCDVSPVTFEKLNINYGDFQSLFDIGIRYLRLDYGFDDIEYIKKLVHNFRVILNASVVNENLLKELISSKIDMNKVVFMHNFYPKRFTGLSIMQFEEKNNLFLKYHLKTQAFVCGDDLKRFPLYEGLPTLEKHRDTNPFIAAVELIKKYHVQDVFIGDSQSKIETLQYINEYINNNVIHIKVHLEKEYENYYDNIFKARQDQSEYSIRLNTSRTPKVPIYHNIKRLKGSITIDNTLMGRYSGEIQLVKRDMPADARVNVIGFIHPEFIDVLEYIDENTKIKLVRL